MGDFLLSVLSPESLEIVAQIIGWLAMAAAIIRYQMKTARRIRGGNVVSAGLFAVHYFFLMSWTASALCAIAALRSAALFHPFLWRYKKYVLLCVLVICSVVFCFTYRSWIDILPLLGLYGGAFMDVQSRAIVTRGLGVVTQILWLIFGILVGSQGGVANNAFNISSNLFGFWRHQLYPYLRTGDKSHFDV